MTNAGLYKRACAVIPGGVNSPVRAFRGVGGTPLFVTEGKGATVRGADGRDYLDFCCSWGAMILGHGHPEIVRTACDAAAKGSTFGIATDGEVAFAETLVSLVPDVECVRAVNSGTEAVMTALRLARGITGRDTIVKFAGCYHGHSDAMLVNAGSGVLTGGEAASAGVPHGAINDTLVLPYNDVKTLLRIFGKRGRSIAAVIVEPLAGNMGLVPPDPEFLRTIRALTTRYGALMICDEVIDGFRFGLSTFSALFGQIHPDILTLGKVIGGGFPLAAVAAKRSVLKYLAPEGNVYQAGTLAGNPVAVAAGRKTLEILRRDNPYPRMSTIGTHLAAEGTLLARAAGVPMHIRAFGGVFTVFCRADRIRDLEDAKACDTALYAKIFHGLLKKGIYIAPSQFECNFISAAHTMEHADRFLAALKATLKTLPKR